MRELLILEEFCFEVAIFSHPEDKVRRHSFKNKRFFALLRMTKILEHLLTGFRFLWRELMEAAGGFEPPNKGFAVPCLSHLATPPFMERATGLEPAT